MQSRRVDWQFALCKLLRAAVQTLRPGSPEQVAGPQCLPLSSGFSVNVSKISLSSSRIMSQVIDPNSANSEVNYVTRALLLQWWHFTAGFLLGSGVGVGDAKEARLPGIQRRFF